MNREVVGITLKNSKDNSLLHIDKETMKYFDNVLALRKKMFDVYDSKNNRFLCDIDWYAHAYTIELKDIICGKLYYEFVAYAKRKGVNING